MKKRFITIAFMAILLIGITGLNAIQVCVVVSGSGSGGWHSTNYPTNHPKMWSSGENNFSVPEVPGATFYCWGESTLASDSDSGSLNPYIVNYFYLDLTGAEPEPDPEPNDD